MKHPRLQLNKRAFWCGVAVLVLLRCGLTGFQQAYTWVGGAPLDDELMFRAAQAIASLRRPSSISVLWSPPSRSSSVLLRCPSSWTRTILWLS